MKVMTQQMFYQLLDEIRWLGYEFYRDEAMNYEPLTRKQFKAIKLRFKTAWKNDTDYVDIKIMYANSPTMKDYEKIWNKEGFAIKEDYLK
jgi:hypothetical protein